MIHVRLKSDHYTLDEELVGLLGYDLPKLHHSAQVSLIKKIVKDWKAGKKYAAHINVMMLLSSELSEKDKQNHLTAIKNVQEMSDALDYDEKIQIMKIIQLEELVAKGCVVKPL